MFEVDKRMTKSNIARTIRFTEDIFEELSDIAIKENVSFNQLVLQCCRYAIKNYSHSSELKSTKEV